MSLNNFNHQSAIASLDAIDHDYVRPTIIDILKDQRNFHLLKYVCHDAFGVHVFPGNMTDYSQKAFLADVNEQLKENNPIHLWANIPLCESRCHYCQFPIELMNARHHKIASKWVDANIAEAKLWLQKIPRLSSTPIGEFNIFGGTPSLLPVPEIEKLVSFYKENFCFNSESTLRFEGNPKTLTKELLGCLKQYGFTKLSFGVQSFDDGILGFCNCPHDSNDILSLVKNFKQCNFDRISIDLIYGLLNQKVSGVERDIQTAINMSFPAIVCSKLHLKTFSESGTSVSGTHEAAWQKSSYRKKLIENGCHFPSLGEQYQMREVLVKHLEKAGYFEHPTMYFTNKGDASEKWKSLMVDQDKQYVEIAIGLGGSSSCTRSQAITEIDKKNYFAKLSQQELPLASVNGFDLFEQEKRSVKMALSTCQPISDEIHQSRFTNSSLFNEYWQGKFRNLQARELAEIDESSRTISLTKDGKTLIESIVNTELSRE